MNNIPIFVLMFIVGLINGDILYLYLKELLNGEDNLNLLDFNIKDKNYWFIKIYSVGTIYLSLLFENNWGLFYIFASIMLIILYYDYLERIIPNDLILALLIIIPVYQYFNGSLGLNILWGTIPAFLFIILGVLIPGSMGMGDIKLFFVLGLFFTIIDMIHIIMFSSILAIVFYVVEKFVFREDKDNTLAYGPYIMLSVFLISLL